MSTYNTPASPELYGGYAASPVLPEWYDEAKHAITQYPQTNFGIFPIAGNAIVQSAASGQVELVDVLTSRLSEEQMGDLRETVMRAHQAYGVERMPEGYTPDHSIVIPDVSLQGIWTDVACTTVQTIADVGSPGINIATYHSTTSGMIDDLKRNATGKKAGEIVPEIFLQGAQALWPLLRDRASKPDFPERLAVLSRLYSEASAVLQSPEAREFGRLRREGFRRVLGETAVDASNRRRLMTHNWTRVVELTRERIVAFASANGIDGHIAKDFLSAMHLF